MHVNQPANQLIARRECCYFNDTALYCPYLWNDYKKSTFSKIRFVFHNAYRKILGLPKRSGASTMYANHNICNFEITLRKNTFGFMQRLEQSTNTIISTL